MKPTTPLPWKFDGIYARSEMTNEEVPVVSRDAAYIVHACNNYPRLVEGLKKIAEQAEATWVQANGLRDSKAAGAAMREARALLKELGEE